LDKLTRAVRAFYEAYPYPSGIPEGEGGIEPVSLLSQVRKASAQTGPLNILEAGCGCGQGLIAMAKRHPSLEFTGIDINPVAIEVGMELAAGEGLENIRFSSADLLKSDTLNPPQSGYDLIYSFGVLHHLADPLAGLKNLKQILAPQGAIAAMVYGRYGREPLQRLLDSIDLAVDSTLPAEQRLVPARLLAAVADQSLFRNTPWAGTALVDEVEFADRCLHVHQQSFDIDSLWSLLEQADMGFVSWLEPDEWSVEKLIEDPAAREMLTALESKMQYKLVERLFQRPKLALLMTAVDGDKP
jgi:SAM-dependent methyltransferase